MGGANTEAPTLEAEERLVEQNETVNLPEKPELPASLDAALDTFIEKLDLEQPGPAEFVLGSALAATAERFGPSEAEILLSRFDEELSAQFFENLIDSGAIPQSPTMNNLLAGDVNSQAAQFILENLAAQSASGAFITMQATRRDPETQEERKRERRAQTLSAALELANNVSSISRQGFFNFDAAGTDEQRQAAFDATVDGMLAEWQAKHPDATPAQINEMRDFYEKLHQSEIYAEYAQQVQSGELSPEQFLKKIATLQDELEKHPELKEAVEGFKEANENLTEAEENLAAAQAALAQGDHNSHVVVYYQDKVEQLREAQAAKVQELVEIRERLLQENAELSEMSLEMLDARISQEEAALAQLQAIEAELDTLGQQTTVTLEAANALAAEVESAELAFDSTQARMHAEEAAIGENISENSTVTQELRALGFATITLGDILAHTPEQLPERFADLINVEDEGMKAALSQRALIVDQDADGKLFVELGHGEKLELTDAMKANIQTTVVAVVHTATAGPDQPSFRTDVEAGGQAFAAYRANHLEFNNGMENYAVAEDAHSTARDNLESLMDEARGYRDELQGYQGQVRAATEEIARLQGEDTTALEADLRIINSRIFETNTILGEVQNRIDQKLGRATSSVSEQELTSTTPIGLNTSLNTSLLDTSLSLSPGLSSSSLLAPRFSDLDFSTINLATLDYSKLDFTTTDFSTLNFNSLTSDFASNDAFSLGGTNSSLMPSYLAYDMSYNFYDYDFFDLDLDTIDFSAIDFDDSFFADTQALLAGIDTGAIQNELDTLNADINEVVQSVLPEEGLPEGIDRAALEEAIRKDIEWNTENAACRPIEDSNVGKLLAAEGVEGFAESMSEPGMSFMGLNLQGMFNGMAKLGENMALAQTISMAADQAAVDGRGQRLVDASKRLQEIEGGEQSTAVAGAAAESLTLESPSLDEITREARLANEARAYADQVRANGVVTERDLEDAFPGLSADEMDLVKNEIETEGIEVRLEEPVAEAPAPTVSEPSASVTNTRSPYEPALMTPGV